MSQDQQELKRDLREQRAQQALLQALQDSLAQQEPLGDKGLLALLALLGHRSPVQPGVPSPGQPVAGRLV